MQGDVGAADFCLQQPVVMGEGKGMDVRLENSRAPTSKSSTLWLLGLFREG